MSTGSHAHTPRRARTLVSRPKGAEAGRAVSTGAAELVPPGTRHRQPPRSGTREGHAGRTRARHHHPSFGSERSGQAWRGVPELIGRCAPLPPLRHCVIAFRPPLCLWSDLAPLLCHWKRARSNARTPFPIKDQRTVQGGLAGGRCDGGGRRLPRVEGVRRRLWERCILCGPDASHDDRSRVVQGVQRVPDCVRSTRTELHPSDLHRALRTSASRARDT